ncbi:iron-containing alcohol dehydrogenase [Tabrizicola sp. J26]|uniref:iron-containing alcohol dehydrogenase n=1 Tax=Alitabrizicola rongguiensis TaxID=2909234 RepID=UPI001F395A4F|nr:iron-containing alcohol dehydrogenase [Tabrizicola rongguiensis]MCF1710831.1 iron-containing alcohol dehydrogenase [Tabrizicola rongguiensis]
MKTFAVLTPPRILFGRGEAAKAPDLIRTFGSRGLVVHGASASRAAWLVEGLRGTGAEVMTLACRAEPVLAGVLEATEAARGFRPDWVAAIGGGAVLDFGKALAALVPSVTPALDHLEVVGKGLPLGTPPLPFIALPTTSGTGSEVTRNAVIGLPEHGRKVSLRDDRMVARLAIVDPALTDGAPHRVTLASGLDAVVQVIEPYVSLKATPYTDALSLPAIKQGIAALARLMEGEDQAARDALSWVSLCGGLALSNGGLGAVHGFAGVLGGIIPAPHGLICGRLIGPVLRANRDRVGGPMAERLDLVFAVLASVLGGRAKDAPESLCDWVAAQRLAPLRAFGLAPDRFEAVAEAAQSSSSMKGNPAALGVADLVAILQHEARIG